MSVVPFVRQPKPEPEGPHVSGEAVCTACKHRWVAVAPAGTIELECPNCGTRRGLFVNPVWPPADHLVWVCPCGGNLFLIREPERGFMCRECGTTQHFNALDSA